MRIAPLLPLLCLAGLLTLGSVGVVIAGSILPDRVTMGVLIVNASFVLVGACLFAFGVRALQKPTSLVMVATDGEDAFGMARYGASHRATAAEGTRFGTGCLVVGFLLVVVGVFAGPLAQAMGMPTH